MSAANPDDAGNQPVPYYLAQSREDWLESTEMILAEARRLRESQDARFSDLRARSLQLAVYLASASLVFAGLRGNLYVPLLVATGLLSAAGLVVALLIQRPAKYADGPRIAQLVAEQWKDRYGPLLMAKELAELHEKQFDSNELVIADRSTLLRWQLALAALTMVTAVGAAVI